ncbi:outer membrane protein assembly factor BamA [Snodgrassella communis]|uniref:Outer membrane protein assembly factor BamA n=1 Tax=Snodgrassella communis TaxID=2946699 RepID=A0A836Z5V0_9NEIS|nr:outer membrane protein assembly factor BamA [Snodgrassella communis]KDN14365.1 Outer membrane protein assembly factor YaeT precursor [Snodgrassella communis]PIT11032.1 outer membrane protein assembly factor BamA [Snodgrassella communis]PIT25530.1 outer membrane protein assembly factor BamA [Snodgrassella communis]PIT27144.1 outer membrane protein assembly factor BamA [Snodgrassella communis]PIT32012.1 outer membrane protein assembly factor BamA [Snodgrassella communis]
MKLKQITVSLMALGLSSLALAVQPFTIKDIRVEGLQRTAPTTVFSYLPVKIGDTFTDAEGENIIKRLYATGFFDDVRVETMGNQVLLTVVERPIISNFDVTGGKSINNNDIKKNLSSFGLGQSRVFNPVILEQAMLGLQDAYRQRGKNAVKITPKVTRLERNRVALELKIDEGSTTTIKSINFTGNKQFSAHTLRNQMSLSQRSWKSWLTRDDRYSDTQLQQDLDKINNYYQDHGYLNFRIADVKVNSSEDKTAQMINITVDEGARYRWGKVTVNGDTREVPVESLQKLIKIKQGKWYNRSQMIDAIRAIQEKMGSSGYAFCQVNIRPIPDENTHIVDFVLSVVPDRKVYVNQINITGNNKTRDEVLRRELRQMERAPYDVSKINRSKERIQQLGYFDNAQVDVRPVADTPDQVDLDVSVKERSTGSINVGAGWAQNDGLLLSAGISQDNLFGTGKSASLQLSRSKVNQVAALSFTDPYFTPDGVSLGYNVYYRGYNPSKSDSNSMDYKTTTIGAAMTMGVPITEYDRVNFSLGAEHLAVNLYGDYAPQRYAEFVKKYGKDNWIFKGTVGWGRNTTDSAVWPTRGYIINANIDSGLPGGDLQYYNISHDQRWYFPLSKNFTFMLYGQLGYADGYGKTKDLPFMYAFNGGGLGSVRGYESGTLGPKYFNRYSDGSYSNDSSSYGGNYIATATAELLFPLPGIKDQHTVRLSMFADAGSVWDNKTYNYFDEKNPYGGSKTHKSSFGNEMRYSAGLAITWLSPMGPLKFSYAYPINKKPEDQLQRFQFQLGTTF